MPTDPRLESYLTSLERALAPLPVSDRADIVTEIKSHVLSALERDPQQPLDTVLSALGAPETVANRYLLERGRAPVKPPISPIVKWLVLGALGAFGMLLLFVALVITRFSPVLTVDEPNEKVSLLGGLIAIDGAKGRVRIGGVDWDEGGQRFQGEFGIGPAAKGAAIRFGNGKFDLVPSTEPKLSWECKGSAGGKPPAAQAQDEAGQINLDFSSYSTVKCTVRVPGGLASSVHGLNGKVLIGRPKGNVHVELANGKVSIVPEKNRQYRYDVEVVNGTAERLDSSADPGAHLIHVRVGNGKISGEEPEEETE